MAEIFVCEPVLDMLRKLAASGLAVPLLLQQVTAGLWGDVVAIEDVPRKKREIACTRSFGQMITQLSSLEQAITDFTC